MKKIIYILLAMVVGSQLSAKAADFTLCNAKYALCTTAPCKPIPGKKGMVSCSCSVHTGYSVGTKSCSIVNKHNKKFATSSRYYPIKSYAVCKNDRPWAWCLDSPCTIDKNNPSKASCLCSLVKEKGDYIIVTQKYTQKTCTKGLYSSATLKGATKITDFLKTHKKELAPFPTKVVHE